MYDSTVSATAYWLPSGQSPAVTNYRRSNPQAASSQDSAFSDTLAKLQSGQNQSHSETPVHVSTLHPFQPGMPPRSSEQNSSEDQCRSRSSQSSPPNTEKQQVSAKTLPKPGQQHSTDDKNPEKNANTQSLSFSAVSAGKVKQTSVSSPTQSTAGSGTETTADPNSQSLTGLVISTDNNPASGTNNSATVEPPAETETCRASSPREASKCIKNNSDLAFAAKIQVGSSTLTTDGSSKTGLQTEGKQQEQATPNLVATEFRAALAATGDRVAQRNALDHGIPQSEDSALATSPFVGSGIESQHPAVLPEPTPKELSATATEFPEMQENKTIGVKAVQVQVTGADNQRVDLRLIEMSGALTVSVRSSDTALTKALQQQLPELSGKLNQQQFRAEWWTPEAQKVIPAHRGSESFNDRDHHENARDQDRQGGNNPRQQGGRGTRQPKWVEELSDLRKSTQNGKQYTWHL